MVEARLRMAIMLCTRVASKAALFALDDDMMVTKGLLYESHS